MQNNRVPRKISHYQEACDAKKGGFGGFVIAVQVFFAGGNMAIVESRKVVSSSR